MTADAGADTDTTSARRPPPRDGDDPFGLTDAQLDDLAAERDDAEPDREAGDPPAGPFYPGTVVGGPAEYDGKRLVSRFPKGLLLVDKPSRRVWIYDYASGAGGGPAFVARGVEAAPLHDDGPVNRWRAAEEPNYDVRVYDPDFDGDDEPVDGPPAETAGSATGGAA